LVWFASRFYAAGDGTYSKAFQHLSAEVHLVALLGYLVKIVYEVHAESGAKYGCGRDGSAPTSLFENNEHFLHAAKGEYRNEN
jgi:hypothetical protein